MREQRISVAVSRADHEVRRQVHDVHARRIDHIIEIDHALGRDRRHSMIRDDYDIDAVVDLSRLESAHEARQCAVHAQHRFPRLGTIGTVPVSLHVRLFEVSHQQSRAFGRREIEPREQRIHTRAESHRVIVRMPVRRMRATDRRVRPTQNIVADGAPCFSAVSQIGSPPHQCASRAMGSLYTNSLSNAGS